MSQRRCGAASPAWTCWPCARPEGRPCNGPSAAQGPRCRPRSTCASRASWRPGTGTPRCEPRPRTGPAHGRRPRPPTESAAWRQWRPAA
eukprot:11223298-Lingulodinium_polyedra.AAC.1